MANRIEQWLFTRSLQQAFLEDLAMLVEDGVPATQAIETIAEISDGVREKVALDMSKRIAEGKLLADGMRAWFARPIVEVVRAGEQGGTLASALSACAQSFGEQTHALRVMINALLYPIAVIILALIVTVFVKNSVLVDFAKIRPVKSWPLAGQHLYTLASLTQHDWWIGVLLIIALAVALAKLLQLLTGPSRRWVDQIPGLALYRQIAAAQFMETLGMLISNGVVLKKALSVLHFDASPYLSWHLLKMEYRLTGGSENIADVLDTDLIDKSDLIRLRVVGQSKGFAPALLSLGAKATRRNGKALEIIGKVSGGILLALGAAIAATLVFGIYLVGSGIAT